MPIPSIYYGRNEKMLCVRGYDNKRRRDVDGTDAEGRQKSLQRPHDQQHSGAVAAKAQGCEKRELQDRAKHPGHGARPDGSELHRGGAHGMYTITYLVFHPGTGALVTEGDLFREGYQEPVGKLMQDSLRASLAEDTDALESIWFDQVLPNGNFCPDRSGITWVFQPYDVAPYALGAISVEVTWEQLKPYLK